MGERAKRCWLALKASSTSDDQPKSLSMGLLKRTGRPSCIRQLPNTLKECKVAVKHQITHHDPRNNSLDIEDPFVDLNTPCWLFIHHPHPYGEKMQCCILLRELRSDRGLAEKFRVRANFVKVRLPDGPRCQLLGWKRTAGERACNETGGGKSPMIRLGDWVEVRTAEECAHWYVNRDDSPVLISKRWSITGAGETIECIPAESLRGSETLAEDRGSTSDHARSSPKIGQQSLEEMFLEYVPPPRRYYSAGPLIPAYSKR